MFFPERILAIKPGHQVLEVGPGAAPFKRANEFLEYKFESELEKVMQRGEIQEEPIFDGRKVHYYSSSRFPFSDRQYDYVICSHVIEHVEDPMVFLSELFRVSRNGAYLEFPLPTLELFYNFRVHKHFIWFDEKERAILFLPKQETSIDQFSSISDVMRRSLEEGWDDVIALNKDCFFFGREFLSPVRIRKARDLSEFRMSWRTGMSGLGRGARRVTNKVIRAFFS